jgi:isopentenyl phosphate kinase
MITYLKLGGSVITEKSRVQVARVETIKRIAAEIASAREQDPELQVVLGHGSGSFGHAVAAEYGTHLGASSKEDWRGFAAVWTAARELNSIVLEALVSEGLPAVSFPPSASGLSSAGELISLAIDPIQHALHAGLLPVVYGDVIFDTQQGSSIASTEEVFTKLADVIPPDRMLLAGRAEGVYDTTGENPVLLEEITSSIQPRLQFDAPEGQDVTGGMSAKVDLCLNLAARFPTMEILIFSAETPGQITRVLLGQRAGTRIGG